MGIKLVSNCEFTYFLRNIWHFRHLFLISCRFLNQHIDYMNKISINLLTNVLLLLAGIAFLIFYNTTGIMEWGARIVGALFMLPSLVFLAVASFRKSNTARNTVLLGTMPAVGGTCFGIVMMVYPQLFTSVLVMLLGVLLCVLGLFHIFYLCLSHKAIGVKAWYFLLPLAVLACGVSILCWDVVKNNESVVMLMAGISLLLFNVSSFQEYLGERKNRCDASADVDSEDIDPDDKKEVTNVEI